MILPADFEQRTLELVRNCIHDIPECDQAQIKIVFQGQAPAIQFAFGDPTWGGDKRFWSKPTLTIGLVAESRQNPLAPGRLVTGDHLRRHLREWVEDYLKLCGIEIFSRKVVTDACL